MSSLPTSSPVSASTFMYLMRWPVLRLIWLKEIFSVSEVAGYSATGQVTSDNRRKPFQLARGAMANSETQQGTKPKDSTGEGDHKGAGGLNLPTALTLDDFALRHAPGGRLRPHRARGRRGTSHHQR